MRLGFNVEAKNLPEQVRIVYGKLNEFASDPQFSYLPSIFCFTDQEAKS